MPREKWINHTPAWAAGTKEQRLLLDAAWRGGHLSFLLTPSQQDSYEKIRKWEAKGLGRMFALDISRRWGKSVLCVVLALEDAIRYPGFRVVYVAPTQDMVTGIILPLIAKLTESCPPGLRPEYLKSERRYVFGNGSRIELVGLDTRPDGARGTGVDKVVLDEAAFFANLEYLVVSVINPQMLGRDHARIIAASTPPITPAHYWSLTVVPECRKANAHDRKTLDEADQYSEQEIEYFYSMMPGGRGGVTARREYGAEHIADASMQIVPEFADAESFVVRELKPPTWRDCYVALDPGYHDLSAVLFGYWHWDHQALVIEDEIAVARMNSRNLADEIKRTEKRLWEGCRRRSGTASQETKPQPYLRISDRDPRLLADLALDHKLAFVATQKDDLAAQVDQVRVAIQQGHIVINPRCKTLILHLKNGVWKTIGHVFARDGGEMGHFDTIAALTYMWRNVQRRRNPNPTLERYVCADLPVGEKSSASKWAAEGEKMRRMGRRYFLRTGRRTG